MLKRVSIEVMNILQDRFERLYGADAHRCIERLHMLIGRYGVGLDPACPLGHWGEKDAVLITYGDMVQAHGERPLETLNGFLAEHVKDAVSSVHILPFFPYSSDDGFSVIDYRKVDPALGEWEDVHAIGSKFRLMVDLVLNHCSSQSEWFKDYVTGIAPFRHYFLEIDPKTDLSDVVRPRNSPVLTKTQTRNGEKHVWTTFSKDQVDLNFPNPDVLFEFLDILFFYISQGARIVRLDAIAYLWKELGTSCIHLPQTHEVVKLIRDVLEMVSPDALIITETNVPHEENISYFGNGKEAHIVYQFSLPPLLLHGLLMGTSHYLTEWAQSIAPPMLGCTFLNFTASHDGVGVRPLEGIIPVEERDQLLEEIRRRGGHVSMKRNSDESESPYELNITYFDALSDPDGNNEAMHVRRFLTSQLVAMALKGIPAIYFHSLTATPNDHEGVERTGRARSINRKKWRRDELEALLEDGTTTTARVFKEYTRLLRLRAQHAAFHPDAPQKVLDLGDKIFGVERKALGGKETIVCLSNFTAKAVQVSTKKIASLPDSEKIMDLVSGKKRGGEGKIRLQSYETCWLVAGSSRANA